MDKVSSDLNSLRSKTQVLKRLQSVSVVDGAAHTQKDDVESNYEPYGSVFGIETIIYWQASCYVVAFRDICVVGWHTCQSESVNTIIEYDSVFSWVWQLLFLGMTASSAILCRSPHVAFLKRVWIVPSISATGVCYENARRIPCSFTGSVQLPPQPRSYWSSLHS